MKVSRRRLHRSFLTLAFCTRRKEEKLQAARDKVKRKKYNFESYGKSEWIIFYLFESYEEYGRQGLNLFILYNL